MWYCPLYPVIGGDKVNLYNRIMKKLRLKKMAAVMALGVMSLTFSAEAAPEINLDLDETIQRALENNRVIKQSIASRESAYWTFRQARRRTAPTVITAGIAIQAHMAETNTADSVKVHPLRCLWKSTALIKKEELPHVTE